MGPGLLNEYRMAVSPGGVKLARQRRSGERVPESSCGEHDPEGVLVSKSRQGCAEGRSGRVITGFSAKSRSNMRWRFSTLPWATLGDRLAMVTLTYPREFPMDGLAVRRHRAMWYRRWRRQWGELRGAWVLEFQERGAPHIHTYVSLPQAMKAQEREGMRGYTNEWALETWSGIVGSGDPLHAKWGVNVRPCFFGEAERSIERISDYFWKESGKLSQKQAPEGYTGLGRAWGIWGMTPIEHEVVLSRDSFVAIRRPLRQLRQKKVQRKIRSRRSGDGLFVTGIDGLGVGVRLHGWAQES